MGAAEAGRTPAAKGMDPDLEAFKARRALVTGKVRFDSAVYTEGGPIGAKAGANYEVTRVTGSRVYYVNELGRVDWASNGYEFV